MSSYGSQGGPPPGQPQDPWQGSGDQSNVPYQWSPPPDRSPSTELPPWRPPSYNDGEGAVWSPSPDPPRRRRGLLIALVVLVLLAGAGGGYYLFAGHGSG